MWLDDIDPELEVTPLLDSGTDCQEKLSSPDGSPMVVSPIVDLLPSQGEDDINLTQILAEFGTLPAFVTPIIDQYAEGGDAPHGITSSRGASGFVRDAGWAGGWCWFDQRSNRGEVSVPITYVA